ncbi:conserved hypothetical protein [Vibrio harveyi]|uniref:hypothetical protein n=1 Tax=Vibrio TaxID=662 RepID=UPI0022CD8A0A|nr:hypothetical protein [Vibrio sp. MarTm2]CAH1196148.1 conserved hypothetical protein [Vibrio harveyi]HCG8548234.1 hypothetical protein [Vibrio parahaemolyticus]MDA0127338.1 hypothetical protein [Vibrio sp. MarTm2]CAH1550649.1 conserved hypothetical protein [Vibrio harveyi]CAH1583187.1 conserved hypothetical protein [Vibrio harveyi]
MKPVLDHTPSTNTPVLVDVGERKWTFSFRYWKQIEYFGLDKSNPSWFVSLIEKLKDLSDKEVRNFVSSGSERDAWRYHSINWNQQNIPIQRKDLDWLASDYRDNEEEYPIVQFQISQALGRVVGFWDENSVFNILLLDPLHNIQPSQRYGYKVDSCSPLSCDYSSLLASIDGLKSGSYCSAHDCGYQEQLVQLSADKTYTNVVMHFLDDSQISEVDALIKADKARDEKEIFEAGLLFLSE